MEEMDSSHSSRKSWDLLRKLGASQQTRKENSITPNAVESNLFKTSNIKPTKQKNVSIANEYKKELERCKDRSTLIDSFIEKYVQIALKNVKNGKAAGADGILAEFIKNLGPKSRSWIARFFTNLAIKGTLPKIWREAKVVAILKPNKTGNDPKNYRPISLLSVVYKLFERLLLGRISPLLKRTLPKKQAGFRSGRNYCEQVLALETHVENGFQKKLKSGAVFLDLSAAYVTVWKRGLLLKLAKILKYKTTLYLLEQKLSNGNLKVYLIGEVSRRKIVQMGFHKDHFSHLHCLTYTLPT